MIFIFVLWAVFLLPWLLPARQRPVERPSLVLVDELHRHASRDRSRRRWGQR